MYIYFYTTSAELLHYFCTTINSTSLSYSISLCWSDKFDEKFNNYSEPNLVIMLIALIKVVFSPLKYQPRKQCFIKSVTAPSMI